MNEGTLKNILVFMNRAAEAGAIKNTIDAMGFAETYQTVSVALAALQTPPAPVAPSKPE